MSKIVYKNEAELMDAIEMYVVESNKRLNGTNIGYHFSGRWLAGSSHNYVLQPVNIIRVLYWMFVNQDSSDRTSSDLITLEFVHGDIIIWSNLIDL